MILCVCVNPALDVSAAVDRVEPDRKLRTDHPVFEAGGGGVNVAKAVRILGGDPHLVAVLGGHTGARVAELIEADGLALETVHIADETRQSVTVTSSASDRQFRFVFPGAALDHEEVENFITAVTSAIEPAAVVVLSGSLSPGLDPGLYRTIIELLPAENPVIVDTSGPALIQASRAPAALIKPSVNELRGAVGRQVGTEPEYVAAAGEVLAKGKAASIAVSLGPGGALLVGRDGEPLRIRPPAVRQVSAVGAGDSMVAAIAVELERTGDLVAAVRFGVAAGTAAVLTPGSQLCRADDVAALAERVVVEPL